jgi:hypothetical protein
VRIVVSILPHLPSSPIAASIPFFLTEAVSGPLHRLTIPSRDDIVASPIRDDAPPDGITSSYYSGQTPQQGGGVGGGRRPASPVIDDPSADLERELAGTHIGRQ